MFGTENSFSGLETTENLRFVKNINDICATCHHQHEDGGTSSMCDGLPVQDTLEIYKFLECKLEIEDSELHGCSDITVDEDAKRSTGQFIEEVSNNNFIEESVKYIQKQNLIGVISKSPRYDDEESTAMIFSTTTEVLPLSNKRNNEITTIEDAYADVTCKIEIEETKIHGLESDSEEGVESIQKCSSEILESVELTANHVQNFQCSFCGSTFKSNHALIVHKRIHAGKKRFKCTQCEEAFASRNCLKDHAKTHTTEEPFYCELCSKPFKEEQALTLHMATHTHPLLHAALTTHMPKHFNNDDKISKTSKRTAKVSLEAEIGRTGRIERNGVINGRNGIDHQANMSYESIELTERDTHPKEHLGLDKDNCIDKKRARSREFVCKYCNNVFSRKQALIAHEHLHTSERPFKCDQCPKAFVARQRLDYHKVTHGEERPFGCKLCAKTFKEKRILKMHMEVHINPRSHVCLICGKGFNRKTGLKAHGRVHSDKRHYVTLLSSESEIVRTDMIEEDGVINDNNRIDHQVSTFMEDRIENCNNKRKDTKDEHVCKYCNKGFKRNQHLREHELLHTGEKPFKCNQCPNAFASRAGLHHHKLIHSTERPFGCELCGKTFKEKRILKFHMEIHANARSHVCSICDQGFNVKDNLRKHMRIHINCDNNGKPKIITDKYAV